MLKEARLILPSQSDGWWNARDVHDDLRERLAMTFGGFTALLGHGGWNDNGTLVEEPVLAYDIAMEETLANERLLIEIALLVKWAAKQKTVYVRLPSGDVKFV